MRSASYGSPLLEKVAFLILAIFLIKLLLSFISAHPASNHGCHLSNELFWPISGDISGQAEATVRDGGTHGPFNCSVCGANNVYSDAWDVMNFRESGQCPVCGANNRLMQLAIVLDAYWKRQHGYSIFDHSAGGNGRTKLKIYHTQCSGPLHERLKRLDGYACSEYYDSVAKSGVYVNGILHEDLQSTSFPKATFDFILSTEVFEHIPDPYKAHREVFRILKRGGYHIFTVPFLEDSEKDVVYAHVDHAGEIVYDKDPSYHLDPIRPKGVLVYTLFGKEMMKKLCDIGFGVEYLRLRRPDHGILGNNGYVFAMQKR